MIKTYDENYKAEWDDFVLKHSINGNFLQTRNFYEYHPSDKYDDASIMIMHNNDIAAVISANTIDEGRTLIAHQGSTYGGIVIGKRYANTSGYKMIFDEMMTHFHERNYVRVELRMHNWLYSPVEERNELLDYFFQLYGFTVRGEIGFYIDLNRLEGDYTRNFEKLKRRKLNKALKHGFTFRELIADEEVIEFYHVLAENMTKFETTPIHTDKELLEFKNKRLKEVTSFYGVYDEDKMVAGSMVWNFCGKKVFHTQYLASRLDSLDGCPNEYLYTQLLKTAINSGYRFLSYGTASLNHGMTYNESLGMYKEGFHCDSYLNRCYIWQR